MIYPVPGYQATSLSLDFPVFFQFEMEEGVKYINFVKEEEFLSLFGNIVEYTPRVALQLFQMRPFPDFATFLSSLEAAVDSLSLEEKVDNDNISRISTLTSP